MNLSPGNAQDIGAREEQQDSFGFSDLGNSAFVEHAGVMAVVADGMGGMAHGAAASKVAVRTFLGAYQTKSPGESIPQALDRALREANSAVVALARGANLEDGMGTTLVAAAVHNGSLYWISAGDSRVYLLRRNELAKLTSDHVYAKELREEVAEGKISRTEALRNDQRSDLTSYLGLPDLPAIDRNVRPFPVRPGESVILCSDGLYKAMPESEIADSFRGDTQSACEGLVQRVLAKRFQHQDNVTVIALTYGSKEAPNGSGPTRVPAAVFGVIFAVLLGTAGFWLWRYLRPPSTPTAIVTQPNVDNATTTSPAEPQPNPPSGTQSGNPPEGGAITPPVPTQNAAKVVFEPPVSDFHDQIVKQHSAEQVITLKNNGVQPLHIRKVGTSGTNSDEFILGKTSCAGTTLQARRDCKITVTFVPKAKGKREATVDVIGTKGEQYTAKLTGAGTEPGHVEVPGEPLTIDPIYLDFREQTIFTSSPDHLITLRNAGKEPLSISISEVDSNYRIELGTCGAPLKPASQCEVHITFAPKSLGQRDVYPVITANGKPHKISLFGTGTAPATTAKPTNNTPAAEGSTAGTEPPKPTGGTSATTGNVSTNTVASSGGTATAGQAQPGKDQTSTVLQRTGPTTAPAVVLSASVLKIKSRRSKDLTLTNTGTAPLKIESITITGENAADFVTNGGDCTKASIPSKGQCSLTIFFKPTKLSPEQEKAKDGAERKAVLEIKDNASDRQQKVQLSSEGKILGVF